MLLPEAAEELEAIASIYGGDFERIGADRGKISVTLERSTEEGGMFTVQLLDIPAARHTSSSTSNGNRRRSTNYSSSSTGGGGRNRRQNSAESSGEGDRPPPPTNTRVRSGRSKQTTPASASASTDNININSNNHNRSSAGRTGRKSDDGPPRRTTPSPEPPRPAEPPRTETETEPEPEQILVQSLPPVEVHFVLPEDYPVVSPPQLHLQSTVLPSRLLMSVKQKALEDSSVPGQPSLYSLVESIRERLTSQAVVVLDARHFPRAQQRNLVPRLRTLLLKHDTKRRQVEFDRSIVPCGICLTEKKGRCCWHFVICDHAFCRLCLHDFFQSLVQEGKVLDVRCPHVDCRGSFEFVERSDLLEILNYVAEEGEDNDDDANDDDTHVDSAQKGSSDTISPDDMVERYVRLMEKQKYEARTDVAWCPREACQHPTILEKEDEDAEDEGGDGVVSTATATATPSNATPSTTTITTNTSALRDARLVICARCEYPFCNTCKKIWHGPHVRCRTANPLDLVRAPTDLPSAISSLTALSKLMDRYDDDDTTDSMRLYMERQCGGRTKFKRLKAFVDGERASRDWLRENTRPCPTCSASVQKLEGCNHMICSVCQQHFCYLCGAWLSAANPYQHYNDPDRHPQCYQRVFEGMPHQDFERLNQQAIADLQIDDHQHGGGGGWGDQDEQWIRALGLDHENAIRIELENGEEQVIRLDD